MSGSHAHLGEPPAAGAQPGQADAGLLRPTRGSPGRPGPGKQLRAGACVCFGWCKQISFLREENEREGVSVCLCVCDRDGGWGRRPVSLPSPLLGLSLSQAPQAASPLCCLQEGTKGWGGTVPLGYCVSLTHSLPLSKALTTPAHREETECPSRHHFATALPQSLISVPGRPSQRIPGWALSREDINILMSVHSDRGQKYSLREERVASGS